MPYLKKVLPAATIYTSEVYTDEYIVYELAEELR
jgi:hypothetical protein